MKSTALLLLGTYLRLVSGFEEIPRCNILLPYWTPLCLQPNFPVWSTKESCVFHELVPFLDNCAARNISSNLFRMADDGVIYAKRKLCLLMGTAKDVLNVKFACNSGKLRKESSFLVTVAHSYTGNKTKPETKPIVKRSLGVNFEKASYSVNITEEGLKDAHVLTVKASNPDRLPLFYKMLPLKDARSADLFHLDRNTGELKTSAKLDREFMDKHVLKITAYEQGNPSRSGSTVVIINVVDVNDHSPVFEKRTFVASVSEAAEMGTTVLHVHARDDDDGEFGDVRYSFETKDHPFEVDANTGIVQVKRPLDRETQEFYRLSVQASDQAEQNPRFSTALVEITLEDTNDNAPEFDRLNYYVEIPENRSWQEKPTIYKISATDPDYGDSGKVRFSIVSGNVGDSFSLDYTTGEMRLVGPLSFKATPVYKLVLRAQDGGAFSLYSTAIMEIEVLDVNDNAPKFYTSKYQESIRENVPEGYEVLRIQAYDADSGQNSAIRYSLELDKNVLNNRFPFKIDERSGRIITTKLLDREENPLFDFYAIASDSGEPPKSAKVRVLISITDVNDNSPAFEHTFYNVSIKENTEKGYQVAKVQAHDKDDLSRIDYSFSSGNHEDKFLILPVEGAGIITLNNHLNYKQCKQYSLSVKATDSGGHFDTTTVLVSVEDVNSAPFFKEHPFSVQILENSPISSTVAVMQASDDDDGKNAEISYSIENSTDHFKIDPVTGVITVSGPLDREKQHSYNLFIVVKDHGSPSLNVSASLSIILKDVNDNAPLFHEPEYSISVSEDTPVGTSFLQVSASDLDAGINSRLTYSFGSETYNDTFYIDATSGTIRIVQRLDREHTQQYNIEVLAIDKGSPAKTGTTWVHIEVEDRNDNAPEFEMNVYHLYIPEDRPIGSKVGRVVARDADSGTNAEIEYLIYAGEDMESFELSRPAEEDEGIDINTRIPLDYESRKNVYRLQMKASSGDLSSVAEIYVHVQDTNDNRPELKDFFVVFNNYPDYFPLYPLGHIPAREPDVNDTLHYSIIAGNEGKLLNLDENTGQLTLSPNLNTNRFISTEMSVCVTDSVNRVCAQCSLRVALVTEEMLLNSVTLRARGKSKEEILSPVPYSRLLDALSTLIPSQRDDVIMFSVQQEETDPGILGAEPVVNISFSIRRPFYSTYVSAQELRELVHLNREGLSAVANVHILPFEDNLCHKEPCPFFEQCENVLRFGTAPEFFETDDFLFRPIDPVSTFVCTCPSGFAASTSQSQCDTEVNLCYSSPCGNNGTCVQKENGYICLCLPSRTGKHCEFPLVTEFCLPGICRGRSRCDASTGQISCRGCQYEPEFATGFCELRARSFAHNAYVTFPPVKQRYRFRIELRVATVKPDGIIFYNGRYEAKNDFMTLLLRNGIPRFRFSLGGDQITTVRLPDIHSNQIADGTWHKISITYLDTAVTLSVDDCNEEIALRFAASVNYKQCAVKIRHQLPDRCRDRTVLCRRFLDLTGPFYLGGVPNLLHTRLGPHDPSYFSGCVADLSFDGALQDLGQVVSDHGSEPGCPRLRDVCSEGRLCEKVDQCVTVWEGYRCMCGEEQGGKDCRSEAGPVLTLKSSDSYGSWKVPEIRTLPLVLGATFRTRQQNCVPLAFDFEGNVLTKPSFFKIVDGFPAFVVDEQKFQQPFPLVSNGQWHSFEISIALTHINFTVDHLYNQTYDVTSPNPSSRALSGIYVGSLSGAIPAPFIGCIKGVHIVNGNNKPVLLKLKDRGHYNTQTGCTPADPCLSATCPLMSICVRDWDAYQCKCLPGYVGSNCVSVCELESICHNGGICVTSSSGYNCQCSEGYTGEHCETILPPSGHRCPSGWWGSPLCGPCACDIFRGFNNSCDKITGKCRCQDNHYYQAHSDSCVACKCNPDGSMKPACDAESGQCLCRPKVVGRQCNRCVDQRGEISRKNGTCEVITNACPGSRSHDILWPRTAFDTVAMQRCPPGSAGKASRACTSQHLWEQPKLHNCTSHHFQHLAAVLEKLDSGLNLSTYYARHVAQELRNATNTSQALYGRDVYIGYRLLMYLLRFELSQTKSMTLTHIQDKDFVGNILESCSKLLDRESELWWSTEVAGLLLDNLQKYGDALANLHQHAYLRPFRINTKNLVFAVDTISSSYSDVVLPKYNNFLPDEARSNQRVEIKLSFGESSAASSSKLHMVFYAVYWTLDHLLSESDSKMLTSPVVSLVVYDQSGTKAETLAVPVLIVFPEADPWPNATRPICSWWHFELSLWMSDGCYIHNRNRTHVTCACTHLSSFAIISDFSSTEFRIVTNEILSYLGPGCAAVGMVLLCMTLVLLCCLRNAEGATNRRAIQVSLVLSLMANVLAFMFVVLAKYYTMLACYLTAALLHFTSLSFFAWLLLSAVNLYRCVTDITDVNKKPFWPYAILGWLLPALIAAAIAVFHPQSVSHNYFCWFALQDPYSWSMMAPVSLLILLTMYVNAMCAMIAFSKEWDLMFAKLNFRTSLLCCFGIQLGGLLLWLLELFSVNMQLLWLHYTHYVVLIAYCLSIFLWIACCDREAQPDLKTAVNLWLNEETPKKSPELVQRLHVGNEEGEEDLKRGFRIDSPLLRDDEAPRNEAESDGLLPQSPIPRFDTNDVIEDQRPMRYQTLPLSNVTTRSKTTFADWESPSLNTQRDLHADSSSTQSRKPDLIPSWEERLNSGGSAVSPPSRYSQASTSSIPTYAAYRSLYRNTGYLSPYKDANATPILSPVQKVLFGEDQSDARHPPTSSFHSYNNSSTVTRLETFSVSPRASPVNLHDVAQAHYGRTEWNTKVERQYNRPRDETVL